MQCCGDRAGMYSQLAIYFLRQLSRICLTAVISSQNQLWQGLVGRLRGIMVDNPGKEVKHPITSLLLDRYRTDDTEAAADRDWVGSE